MLEGKSVGLGRIGPFFFYEVVSAAAGAGVSIASTWLNFDPLPSCILGVVVTILLLVAHAERARTDAEKRLAAIEAQVQRLRVGHQLADEMGAARHPYFQKLVSHRIERFRVEHASLLAQTFETNPQSADTFGIEGVKLTRFRLECLSAIPAYWNDTRNVADVRRDGYLRAQKALIEDRGVQIERIFVFPSTEEAYFEPIMRFQRKLGIIVFYVHADGMHNLDQEWLREDYLIQDESLLVELVDWKMDTGRSVYSAREIVTAVPAVVNEKRAKYKKVRSAATQFI